MNLVSSLFSLVALAVSSQEKPPVLEEKMFRARRSSRRTRGEEQIIELWSQTFSVYTSM